MWADGGRVPRQLRLRDDDAGDGAEGGPRPGRPPSPGSLHASSKEVLFQRRLFAAAAHPDEEPVIVAAMKECLRVSDYGDVVSSCSQIALRMEQDFR